MSIHFHKLKIREVKKETGDCVSIVFYVPDELKNVYSFSHGQNVTLRTSILGEEVRRSYSICAAPYENELRVAVKRAEKGLFSGFANSELKAGDEIEVLPPTGKFYTSLHGTQKKNYLALAAGSGITPVISIIKTTLNEEPLSRFTLVYSNRSRSSIIFLEELEALKNKYINRFILINILSREKTDAPVNSGRLNYNKLNELDKLVDYQTMDELFICGPEEMIFTIHDFLIARGIEKKKIHFELFNTVKRKRTEDRSKKTEDDKYQSKVVIKLDGRTFDFDLKFDGDCILDAALKQGADLPYACKGGVCASCRAKLTEGEVDMEMNWALEPEEIEQGYILTCQSHPKTERVVIDFDNR
ncbi:MAG: paaK [Chitinophagaceae bacterium]|nr:paaK [Chitinophagaceae bacterium]